MPFPLNQEAMLAAGYSYSRWERCPACTLDVEVWLTPGKREIQMKPMPGFKSPAVRHFETCKPKAPENIKMFGVTDKNMMAVGWQEGILEIAFRHGQYRYSNVPENVFLTIRKVPYPNNYFTKVVKNHPELYPYTKVE